MRKQSTRLGERALFVVIAAIALSGCRTDSPVAPAASSLAPTSIDASRQATTSGRILFLRFVDFANHLFSMDDDGTNVRLVSGAFASATFGSWAPDGKRIVISATTPANPVPSLYIMNDDGTGVTPLTVPPSGCQDLYPSTFGKAIAFVRTCPTTAALTLVDLDGGLTPLVDSVSAQVAPSPRTNEIVYSQNGDLWRIDVSTREITRLTNTPGFEFQPAVSPNGKRIAFTLTELAIPRILTMNPDGTMITVVATEGISPVWSPDGKRIAFRTEAIPDVFVMNADGTGVTNLTQTPEFEAPMAWARY